MLIRNSQNRLAKYFFVLSIVFLTESFASARTLGCPIWFGKTSEISSHVSPVVAKNRFIFKRKLWEYTSDLFEGFSLSLQKLKGSEVWIDLGGGRGNAVEDYVRDKIRIGEKPAQTVLITYKLGRLFGMKKYGGKIQVFENRLFEDIPDSEIPQAKLMTDLFGVISYTKDLTLTLHKIFSHLEVGGELYVYSDSKSTMIHVNDEIISLTKFLRRIPGLDVEGESGILKVTKVSESISIPNLKLVSIDEKTKPFHRRFIQH